MARFEGALGRLTLLDFKRLKTLQIGRGIRMGSGCAGSSGGRLSLCRIELLYGRVNLHIDAMGTMLSTSSRVSGTPRKPRFVFSHEAPTASESPVGSFHPAAQPNQSQAHEQV